MQLMTKSRQLEAQGSLGSQGNTLGTSVLYTNWLGPVRKNSAFPCLMWKIKMDHDYLRGCSWCSWECVQERAEQDFGSLSGSQSNVDVWDCAAIYLDTYT